MNRNVLILSGIGVFLLLIGVAGFAGLLYFVSQGLDLGPGKKPPHVIPNPPPFNQVQMEDFHDNPDKAAKEISRIIECFENGDEDLRMMAAETLKNVGKPAVEPFAPKLTHENEEVRFGCVQTLAFLKEDAAPAIDDLLKCVHDVNPRVRYKAVYAVGQTGVKSEAVFRGLLSALEDSDDRVPETAISVLEEIGAPLKEALPAIAKSATKGATPQIRHTAVKLLGKLGEAAVPTFREVLKNMKVDDEPAVFQAIGLLGADAKSLIPDLVPILTRQVRGPSHEPAMIDIFKKCDPDGAKGLADVLKATDGEQLAWSARPFMLKAVGEMRSEASAKASVPILIEMLKGNKSNVREQILETLGDIGVAAKAAIPAVEALVNENTPKDDPARVALRRMGKIAK